MLSNNVGGVPGLGLLFQQQLLLLYREQEQKSEKKQATIVRGVPWLREPLSKSKAAPRGAPPEVGSWTCPRCRSHRCICTTPGNSHDPVYRCCICGYTFRKTSATCLLETAPD